MAKEQKVLLFSFLTWSNTNFLYKSLKRCPLGMLDMMVSSLDMYCMCPSFPHETNFSYKQLPVMVFCALNREIAMFS